MRVSTGQRGIGRKREAEKRKGGDGEKGSIKVDV